MILAPCCTDGDDTVMAMWAVVFGDIDEEGTPRTVAWTDRRADAERIERALALTSPPQGPMVRACACQIHVGLQPCDGPWL